MLWGAHQGDLELRETGGEIRLSGRFPYATQTTLREAQRGQPELREVFAPRAFSVQSEPRAIYLLSGHDMAKPLASTTNGTLQMVEDEAALSFEPKFINKIDKCLISFRPNGQKCYNKSAVRLALAG